MIKIIYVNRFFINQSFADYGHSDYVTFYTHTPIDNTYINNIVNMLQRYYNCRIVDTNAIMDIINNSLDIVDVQHIFVYNYNVL